ncbi:pyruvate kinase [Oxobacter pfennigii]|uniref:Pyruvate kinase n=1 Tax=Oxobacter pfennigii TaxID=36849 RepID=A0A0N8NT00_9CLOT|nr:pyruvate kinase [Oxobacter pfennigii]KPU43448.1 pyruvate kinase [Oxobacter pfennigii]
MRKTKIVCTIGPACESQEILEQLIQSGMNCARLNFSHGNHEEHGKRIDSITKLRNRLDKPVSIMLDTKGPEIRTGNFKGGKVELIEGQKFTFTTREVEGDDTICSLSYENVHKDLKIGDTVLIDDGLVGFKVNAIVGTEIHCTVLNSGSISNHKGVNVPGVSVNLPSLTKKDIDDILFGISKGIDIIAASFIRKAADVIAIRRVLEQNGGDKISIISKIENREGVSNIDEIIKFSDGIMVARGDLGVEIPVEEVPLVQKMIIEKCNKAAKPVITATQMLDSMIRNPRPTRAEASDVANAIFDGTDCIMLSGETAGGKYPLEAVTTMAKIALRTEESLQYNKELEKRRPTIIDSVPGAISYAACTTAAELGASVILATTQTGHTARMVSKYRPKSPIIAVTPYDQVARKLSIFWGVYPLIAEKMESTDELIDLSVEKALQSGYVKKGELLVIAAGIPVGFTRTTNMLKVHIAGDILVKGTGIGSNSVYGSAAVVKDLSSAEERLADGDILVVKKLEKDYIYLLDRVLGIVSEEGGFTSHVAIECISRGIPVISGAQGATDIIRSGTLITLDTNRGLVFSGKANVV